MIYDGRGKKIQRMVRGRGEKKKVAPRFDYLNGGSIPGMIQEYLSFLPIRCIPSERAVINWIKKKKECYPYPSAVRLILV